MTAGPIASRDRLHRTYAAAQPGRAGSGAALIYRRDIRPALPRPSAGPVVDIGCGPGDLVRLLAADGYEAEGVDLSAEQVARAQAAGLAQVHLGDYRQRLLDRRGQFAAVTATDLLEHLTKDEVLDTLDHVIWALAPGGVFVARVECRQPARRLRPVRGFHPGVVVHGAQRPADHRGGGLLVGGRAAVPAAAHGLMSAARVAAWKPVSGLCKIALAAETGVLRGHVVTQNLTFVARKA